MSEAKLSPETIEKLEWLKGRLRKHPHRYGQGSWCGTQACLAGLCWPRMLGKRTVTIGWADEDRSFAAISGGGGLLTGWAKWLGVNRNKAALLFTGYWTEEAAKFNRLPCDTAKQAAEKACQRIDLFIESGGTQ